MADCSRIIVPLDNLLEHYGGHTQLRTIVNEGLHDYALQKRIVDASKLFASVFDELKISVRDEGWNDKLSDTSSKYKDNPELVNHFTNWCKSRKEMIRITKSAAEELDQPSFIINIARMIGSFAEILNSLNLAMYQKFSFIISSYAYNISPKLGFIMESALELAPHLRFMGFASSFLDILRSQVIINNVMNAIKNDKDMLTPLKEWFDETKEIDDLVKKLFPYGINKEITISIENAFEDLGKEEKIFFATVLSNLMEDPMIHKNENFMVKAFLFCISDAAKEWYKRLITGVCPLDLECEMFYLRNELLQLKGSYPDSASKLELAKCTVDQLEYIITKNIRSNLRRLVICCMSGMSIYYCYENIRAGSKHRYSDKLRELSKNAQSFLNTMEKIRF
ncbi:hypothetical protein AVEN_40659-1 [Araneus ventricosus]|uniref:Uncharacterized protein n=1 Tax=Araneus ventricosus TaxID=182803 RepID=A0A4Y2H100_ARAVE|nr:hypothetical protein AVEN_40659-1 [Araneus ventricosus]